MAAGTEKRDGARMVCIENDMTILNAAALKKLLLDSLDSVPGLLLDLSRVGEMDTSGFQLLVLIKREAQVTGKGFRIASVSPAVEAVLDLYAMKDFFGL
ncbi:MAG: STAS domain-containing protein [Alphaproteobacteria bacterium]|uniref:STAS domain-containing protein n=1 Tax=Candidatus Nitrobium versatile TaxID=2884831 RepID=A0A953LX06_9BACT|nr:STAS domain-containing protein [Candidatus Nitrobium versatile]